MLYLNKNYNRPVYYKLHQIFYVVIILSLIGIMNTVYAEKTRCPLFPFTAKYEIIKGHHMVMGHQTLSLNYTGHQNFEAKSVMSIYSTVAKQVFNTTSKGQYDEKGFTADTYSLLQTPDNYKRSISLPESRYDPLSVILQLRYELLNTDKQKFSYDVDEGRRRLKTYFTRIPGTQIITRGEIKYTTIEVEGYENNKKIFYYFVPNLDALPLQIIETQRGQVLAQANLIDYSATPTEYCVSK